MSFGTKEIKELRSKTGAGMLDVRNALKECDGDVEKAFDLLRKEGLASAAKRSEKVAAEGLVDAYIHGGRIGAMIEVNSETDFVAKNQEFKEFVSDIAMHVAAAKPLYVTREDVPEEEVEREKAILTEQVINDGKPEHIAEKIVAGRMDKFYERIVLLDQPFIKEPSLTVEELLKNLIARIGENIVIRRFERFEVGEGIEVEEEDFAAEVAAQMK